MEQNMMAYCGTYCGVCSWREKTGCPGCKACGGDVFWGVCQNAKCCKDKGQEHCGHCAQLPCQSLTDAFNHPEHGDDGTRLRNLRGWAAGQQTFEHLRGGGES